MKTDSCLAPKHGGNYGETRQTGNQKQAPQSEVRLAAPFAARPPPPKPLHRPCAPSDRHVKPLSKVVRSPSIVVSPSFVLLLLCLTSVLHCACRHGTEQLRRHLSLLPFLSRWWLARPGRSSRTHSLINERAHCVGRGGLLSCPQTKQTDRSWKTIGCAGSLPYWRWSL